LTGTLPALAGGSGGAIGVAAATPSFAAVVERASANAHDGLPLALAVTVRAYRGEPPKYVAVVAMPSADVEAAPVRTDLREIAPGRFAGALTLGVRGRWILEVRMARARAPAEIARLPIAVTAAGAPPRWTGWLVALVPLALCAAFARKAWRRTPPGRPEARTLFTRA
jgi:hypothetical protein